VRQFHGAQRHTTVAVWALANLAVVRSHLPGAALYRGYDEGVMVAELATYGAWGPLTIPAVRWFV